MMMCRVATWSDMKELEHHDHSHDRPANSLHQRQETNFHQRLGNGLHPWPENNLDHPINGHHQPMGNGHIRPKNGLHHEQSNSHDRPTYSHSRSLKNQTVTNLNQQLNNLNHPTLKRYYSLSENLKKEIEAIEACKWLRAAGFPQYAQMYEEHQFPIEISSVEKDHDFLDEDSIQSLFRRLTTLNKCATMKIEAPHRKSTDDSDEEEQCALSDKWRYQRSSRRWSRRDLDNRDLLGNTISYTIGGQSRPIRSSSSHDSVITDDIDDSLSPNDESPVFKSRADHGQVSDSDISQASSSGPLSPASLRRSASERFKGASKSFLTRMQSLKAGKKKHPTTSSAAAKFPPNKMLEISGPVVIEQEEMRQRMDRLGCVDISPTSEGASSLHPALSSSDSGTSGHSLPHTSRTPLTDPTPRRYMGRHSPTQDSIPTSHKKVNQSVIHSETHPTSQSYSKAELVASGRLSTYDNLDDDPAGAPTKSDPQSELDIILRDLYENISGLNRTLGDSDDIDSEKTTNIPSASTTSSTTSSSTNKAPTTNSGSNCINQVTDNNSSSPVEQASSKQDKNLASSSSTNWSDCTTTSVNGITTTTSNFSSMWTESSTTTTSTYTSESTTRGTQRGENGSGSGYNHPTRSDRSENGAESRLNHGEKRDVNHPSAGSSDNPSLGAGMSALDSSQMDLVDIELLDQMVTHKQDSNSTRADTPPSGSSSAAESNHEDEPEPDSGGGGGGGGSRERRDSGVGSSLTRAPSDRRRHRIRWHSFMKSHRPSLSSRNLQISSMSAGQMMVLRRLCLLKVTALMEKFSPSSKSGWNWVMPKFMKRFKSPDYSDKNVFGVPLQVILQRTGQPLPQCILYAMRCLRRTAQDAVGIFRKSGVKSRIQKLRNEVETSPESVDFESLQPYDVADLLKQYFRELPECLLTNKLSESFINIFTHVPADMRLEALQATVMLLPDENCEVLQSLLLFLGDMAQHAQHNQMTASNLAVCFAPSLFHMCGSGPSYPGTTASPKRGRKAGSGGGLAAGIPDARELMEQKAAHECLTRMITDCKKIFMVPEEMLSKFRFSYMEQGDPVPLCELGRSRGTDGELQTGGSGSGAGAPGDYRAHMELCIQGLLKEARDRFKGWVTVSAGGAAGGATELAYRKVGDGHPLRLWKTTVDVEAPPVEVLSRLLHQRHLWDEDLLKWRVVEKLDAQTDVFQYVVNTMAPHPTRDYCELRAWRSDLPPRGACVLVSTSVEHEAASLLGGIRGVILASRYLIEPGGAGRSRLTHIARVDIRGHSVEWYNKVYGHLCANQMRRIRDSFQRTISNTDGPETKI